MKTRKKINKWLKITPVVLMTVTMSGTTMVPNIAQAALAQSFNDVPANHWAYAAVTKLAQAGIVTGYDDSYYKGDKTITRYEMAVIVAKAIDQYDTANDADKQTIDKLSAEFAGELNNLGVRVAKVEAKTNTWISGETRFRYMGNDAKAPGMEKLRGSDNFEFRQRVKLNANINDNISMTARANASNKAGNYDNANGSTVTFDIFAVTAKNALGFDSIRAGRFPYDAFTHGLFGKAIGVDGVRFDKTIGTTQFTGSVNDVVGNGSAANAYKDSATGDAKTLSTAQLNFKASKNLNVMGGYYWSDVSGSSSTNGVGGTMNITTGDGFKNSKGWALGFDAKLGDKLLLIGDYVSTKLNGVTGTYLSDSPKGWAVELTNATKFPPAFYGAKPLVDYKKVNDFGWSVSYRSVEAGATPYGASGFDGQAVSYTSGTAYPTYLKGQDNIKGLFVAVANTVAKNVVWTIEVQDLKIKDSKLTGGVSDLGKTYLSKIEFFY